MKTFILSLILASSVLFLNNNLFASHFAGADLTYLNVGGNTYKISLSFYRDCSGAPAPSSIPITAVCSSNTNFNFNLTLNILANTGQEITNICAAQHSSCTTGPNSIYGIREYVYQTTVTLPPCTDWLLSYTSGARNPTTTLSGNGNWFLPIQINNLNAPGNSAPIYYNKIIPTIIQGQTAYMDLGGIDPDGDSLVYSFYTPFTNNMNSTVTYIPPYSSTNFLPSSTPITLDSQTGIITCTPTQIMNTVFGIKIDQWRNVNGSMMKIGTTYRDLNLKVINAVNNNPPHLSGMDFSNSHIYNINDTLFEKTICANELIEFDINILDIDILDTTTIGHPENVTISWNNGISGANFTTYNNNTDSAYSHFSWFSTNNDTSITPKCFTVTVIDSACPYYNVVSKQYCLLVKGSETINLNITSANICSDTFLTFIAQTSASNPNYIWKWNSNIINTPQNSNTFVYIASDYLPSVDTITVTVPNPNPNSCNATDTAIIKNTYQPFVNISDTAYCVNDSIIINAGNGTTYEWKDANGNIIGTNQTQVFNNFGLYNVYVNGGINSQCYDRDTFSVLASIPPVVNLGNDTTLQPYNILTLDAGPNHSYLWSTGDTTQTITLTPYTLPLGTQQYWVMVYDQGCPTFDTININIITGINNAYKHFKIDIAPNPNDGQFNLEIINNSGKIQKFKIEVISVMGTLVYQEKFSGGSFIRKQMNFETLSKGVYIIKLKNKNSVLNAKFIIE